MRTFFLCLLLGVSYFLDAQGVGTFHAKNETIYYSGGTNTFIVGFSSKGYKVGCVNMTTDSITEVVLNSPKGKIVNMNAVAGLNKFYRIAEVSDKSGSASFSDLEISSWEGDGLPQDYSFPGRWNGNLRYALASDYDIYFVVDRQVTGFLEDDLYRSRFALLRFDALSGLLTELPFALPMTTDGTQCSFWCPLRIGDNFTEWYRTKVINKFFVYEIVRLDAGGRIVNTSTYNPLYPCKIPDLVPEFSRVASNIYINSNALSTTNSDNVTATSFLTIAPLHYVPQTNSYFSVAYVSEFKDKYTRGISYFVLSDTWNLLHWGTYSDIIQGGYDVTPPKNFDVVSVEAALGDSGFFFEINYKKLGGKVLQRRSYSITAGHIHDEPDLSPMSALCCYYFPGVGAERNCRSKMSFPFSDALYAFNREHAIYFVASAKMDNVYVMDIAR